MANLSDLFKDWQKNTDEASQNINKMLDKELSTFRASVKEKLRQEAHSLENAITEMGKAYRSELDRNLRKAKENTLRKGKWLFLAVILLYVIVIMPTFLYENWMVKRIIQMQTEIESLEAVRAGLEYPTVTYEGKEYIRIVPESQVTLVKPVRTWVGGEKATPIGTYACIYKPRKKEP